jgi:hypothetical protein
MPERVKEPAAHRRCARVRGSTDHADDVVCLFKDRRGDGTSRISARVQERVWFCFMRPEEKAVSVNLVVVDQAVDMTAAHASRYLQ